MADQDVMVQMRLPRELHARLKQMASEFEHGLATEVRHRLEASFAEVPARDDPETRRLLNAIARIAGEVVAAYGAPWINVDGDKDQYAARVFRDAITELLDIALVAGEDVKRPPKPGSRIATVLERHPDSDPGVMIGFSAAVEEGFI